MSPLYDSLGMNPAGDICFSQFESQSQSPIMQIGSVSLRLGPHPYGGRGPWREQLW